MATTNSNMKRRHASTAASTSMSTSTGGTGSIASLVAFVKEEDENLMLHVLSFLSIVDVTTLQRTNKSILYDFIDQHQNDIYHPRLINDFPEGKFLKEAFLRSQRDVPCYKKLYRAFVQRFNIEKECDDWYDGENVMTNWERHRASIEAKTNVDADGDGEIGNVKKKQKTEADDNVQQWKTKMLQYFDSLEPEERKCYNKIFRMTNDPVVDSLVFIVRVNDSPSGNTCGFLGWYNTPGGTEVLQIREEWYEDWVCKYNGVEYRSELTEPLDLPELSDKWRGYMDLVADGETRSRDVTDFQRRQIQQSINWKVIMTFCLTVHVVNIETCKVITLLDDAFGCLDTVDLTNKKHFSIFRPSESGYSVPDFSLESDEEPDEEPKEEPDEEPDKEPDEESDEEPGYFFSMGYLYKISRERNSGKTYLGFHDSIMIFPVLDDKIRCDKHEFCSYVRALMDAKCKDVGSKCLSS